MSCHVILKLLFADNFVTVPCNINIVHSVHEEQQAICNSIYFVCNMYNVCIQCALNTVHTQSSNYTYVLYSICTNVDKDVCNVYINMYSIQHTIYSTHTDYTGDYFIVYTSYKELCVFLLYFKS